MSRKHTVSFTCDKNIWDLAGNKLHTSRSEFLETQLKMAIGLKDEETEIVKKINKKQSEINVLKDRLCTIRENKKQEKLIVNNGVESLDLAFKVAERTHERLKHIGMNRIELIAKQFEVEKDDLRDLCVERGFEIVQFS